MSDPKLSPRFPVAFVIGLALLTFALIAYVASGGDAAGISLLLGVAGLVLLCTGLIQRSIEKSRR